LFVAHDGGLARIELELLPTRRDRLDLSRILLELLFDGNERLLHRTGQALALRELRQALGVQLTDIPLQKRQELAREARFVFLIVAPEAPWELVVALHPQ
jgi:hypothetical protein